MKKKRLLVIYLAEPRYNPQKTYHHLHVFDNLSEDYDVTYFNAKAWWGHEVDNNQLTTLDQDAFDVVVLHYTLLIRRQNPKFYKLLKQLSWLSNSNVLKIAIPQDEGTCSHVLDEILHLLGINIILSTHYTVDSPLYPLCRQHAFIQRCLPAYVESSVDSGIENRIKDRSTDVFYRARSQPLYFGESLYLKGKIAEVFADKAGIRGLNFDISTRIEDRMNGPEWFDALRNSKMVLGTYAGYNTINPYGERKAQFEFISSKGDVADNNHVLSFLNANEWNHCELHTIASRHFEAIQAGTCQLLIEGEYRGVLKPGIHYISVNKDFSNVDEILDKAQDLDYLQKIADQAYQDIILSNKYSFDVFARLIHDTIEAYENHAKTVSLVSKDEKLNRLYINTLKHKSIYDHRVKLIQSLADSADENSPFMALTTKMPTAPQPGLTSMIKNEIKKHPRLFKGAKYIRNLTRTRNT